MEKCDRFSSRRQSTGARWWMENRKWIRSSKCFSHPLKLPCHSSFINVPTWASIEPETSHYHARLLHFTPRETSSSTFWSPMESASCSDSLWHSRCSKFLVTVSRRKALEPANKDQMITSEKDFCFSLFKLLSKWLTLSRNGTELTKQPHKTKV